MPIAVSKFTFIYLSISIHPYIYMTLPISTYLGFCVYTFMAFYIRLPLYINVRLIPVLYLYHYTCIYTDISTAMYFYFYTQYLCHIFIILHLCLYLSLYVYGSAPTLMHYVHNARISTYPCTSIPTPL